MARARYQCVDRIVETARLLGDLAEQFVFVGGAATGLLITDPAIPNLRPTLDVDVIVEVATRFEYYRLEDALRERGFQNDMDVVCRWHHGPIVLDVMPTDPAILGFANRWYGDAARHALAMELDGIPLRVVSSPYFLATKLEAFRGRGEGDFMASHDMEDLIALIDGRLEIVADVEAADNEVRDYLAQSMGHLLANDDFLDALPGHLPGDAASQQRMPIIEERMREIAKMR
ncbi:hypothetical protein [Paucidesulfovibrio longus]|uniref:hypothetical protein n=1 Tax=Paucidesulfovibrio longus TaxID=889 RepID=UPI0003B5B3A6|nr:hypothetical protein [Paucidesulfovibrio longus]